MTTPPAGQVTQIEQPVLRQGRLHCPRCNGRLLYDGEDLVCFACGYEYLPEERELVAFGKGRTPQHAGTAAALGIGAGALAVAALGKAGIILAGIAAILLAAGAVLRTIRRRAI